MTPVNGRFTGEDRIRVFLHYPDSIDVFPQVQTQQSIIETTPSSVSEEDIIIPFPSGRIIAPQLLTPWDVFPALTQQETSIWVIANGSYESGSSITGDAVVFGSATKSEEKVRRQMERRGWTEEDVRQTVDNPYTIRKSENKATGNSATVYYTKEGAYVTVDDVTNEIVQISDRSCPEEWAPDNTIVDPYIPGGN